MHESFPSVTSQSHGRSAASNHDFVLLPSRRVLHIISLWMYCTSVLPPTAPVINHPPRLKNRPETRICCSTAASCAFNQKMQLTEPILHSPFTPLHSTPLHLLSLHPTPPHHHAASPSLSPGCHQNAWPVWRTTHRVIINKRR